jgi:hypothetical protein
MTFDELWRADLAKRQHQTDTATTQTVAVKDLKESKLTNEDRIFLRQVGKRNQKHRAGKWLCACARAKPRRPREHIVNDEIWCGKLRRQSRQPH